MSEQTLKIDEKTWQDVFKKINKIKQKKGHLRPNVETHCRIPLCIGFKKTITFEEIEAELQSMVTNKFDFTFYTSFAEGCVFHSVAKLPHDLIQYDNTYVYSEETNELFYVKKQQIEKVNIKDLAIFQTTFALMMSEHKEKRLTEEQIQTLISANSDHVFVNVKQEWQQALAAWCAENPRSFLNVVKEKNIRDIRQWRESSEWQVAERALETLSKGPRATAYQEALKISKEKFCEKHPEVDLAAAEEHVILEAIDFISWMEKEGKTAEEIIKLNVLIYDKPLSQLMYFALSNAHNIYRDPNSLARIKPKFKPVENKMTDVRKQNEKSETQTVDNMHIEENPQGEGQVKDRLIVLAEVLTKLIKEGKCDVQIGGSLLAHAHITFDQQLSPSNSLSPQSNSPTELERLPHKGHDLNTMNAQDRMVEDKETRLVRPPSPPDMRDSSPKNVSPQNSRCEVTNESLVGRNKFSFNRKETSPVLSNSLFKDSVTPFSINDSKSSYRPR